MPTETLRSLSPCIIPESINGANNPAYVPVSILVNAIKDKNIKNIAITGNFGSGKSSVIQTALQKLPKENQSISVSLAMLNASSEDSTPPVPSDGNTVHDIDNQIECSILQQILCSAHPEDIPKSKFNRLYKVSWQTVIFITLLLLTSLLYLSVIFEPGFIYIESIAERFIVSTRVKFWVDIACVFGICLNIILAAFYISNHIGLLLKRISIKGAEIELGTNSIFNKNIDELIYFFACTHNNVVAFEDLDRFKEKSYIFNKLRELNRILNNSKYVNKNCGKITFIYAVKDDLFNDVDRVKFFDYLIPIIPVINTYNSYDKLIESFDSSDREALDGKDLMNLCEYLDDMRLLLNIINEYELYKKIIDMSVLKQKNLFGLIVYKNYFPNDFSSLCNKEGVLASIIGNTKVYAQNVRNGYLKKADDYDNQITELRNKEQNSLKELRKKYVDIYKQKGCGYYSYVDSICDDKHYYPFDKFIESEKTFDLLRYNSIELVYYYSGQNRSFGKLLPFTQIEVLVDPDKTYEEQRKKLLLDEEIKELISHKNANMIYAASVSEDLSTLAKSVLSLIEKELERLKNPKNINLVKYLILSGYIDEQYINYISFFYPQSLGTVERDFIIQSTSRTSKNHTAKLTKTVAIINRFEPADFYDNEYLLNNALVKEIFSNKDFESYREAIVKNVIESNNVDFVRSCYSDTETIIDSSFYHKVFGQMSSSTTDKFFLKKEDGSYDIMLEAYLKYAPLKNKERLSKVIRFIENNFNYIVERMNNLTSLRTIKILKSLNIKFHNINIHKDIPEELRSYVIDNNAYVINDNNISSVMKCWSLYRDYNKAALTTILAAPSKQFSEYITSDLGRAISVFPESSLFESDRAISVILNTELSVRIRNTYLRKQKKKLSTPVNLSAAALKYAYRHSLIEPTWGNLSYYMIDKGFAIPSGFLSGNKLTDFAGVSPEKSEILVSKLLATNVLPLDAYRNVADSYGKQMTSVNDDLSIDRLQILLERNMLALSEQTYSICCNNGCGKDILTNNMDVYLEKPSLYHLNGSILDAVLNEVKTIQKKSELIASLSMQNIHPLQTSADFITQCVYNGVLEVNDINPYTLEQSISMCKDDSIRMNVAKKALFDRMWDKKRVINVINALSIYDKEYGRLISNTASSTITNSYNNLRIVSHLKKHQMITDYFVKNDRIHIVKNK